MAASDKPSDLMRSASSRRSAGASASGLISPATAYTWIPAGAELLRLADALPDGQAQGIHHDADLHGVAPFASTVTSRSSREDA